ncbi:hypothetical protein EV385_4107 [Krasilnikovia cinnamomea]|uniref:Uncharacterized protein n=1 Tax=Krasilnikovia cinnamomea TaxID=349313 RepID=A0A4Q7ZPK0_9ACTN|nr:hypothetical protein [Krasilnikovia cinnamomea]RZU52259.1 hypothetical protein EV385_4107 [Krasilnikovia cinnamomea]
MTRQCTLPSTREQAQHALILLGAPTPPRLVVEVHAALFDSDLSVPGLARLLRQEEREHEEGARRPYLICPGLDADLAPASGLVTLSTWPVAHRLALPAAARADHLTRVVRVAEFVAAAPRPTPGATLLLRRLADTVPGGAEAHDVLDPAALATAARAALTDRRLAAAVAAEQPVREAAAARADSLDERQRLFGLGPRPRGRG